MTVATLNPKDGKRVPRAASAYVSVDVDIDADDLHDQGWHHENECPHTAGKTEQSTEYDNITLRAAVESLHRQAHGPAPVTVCYAEPCRMLSLNQLRGAA